jgi:glycosyltransferase involved in cell wall biosynthesis
VTSHPVQYQAPLFQQLARNPQLDLTVYYGHDGGVAGTLDGGFGVPIVWDRPLLSGYTSHFLRSQSRPLSLLGHLWRGHYDAVLIHSYATPLSLIAYAAARLTRTPILLRTESHLLRARPAVLERIKTAVLRIVFRLTGAFLVIGDANRQFFEHYGADNRRMFRTPYCVDNEYLSGQALQLATEKPRIMREIGLNSARPVIAYCGKLIERKRVADLIRAIGLAAQRGRPAQLMVVGDGPLYAPLKQLCRSHSIDATFVGFQNQTQLARYYVCADVCVLPSSYETWGLVINEAMACGLPVVTTTVVGAGVDLVIPGVTGYTYPPGDCAALADCLERLIGDPALRKTMGEAARQRVDPHNYQECTAGIISALEFVGRRARTVTPAP